MLGGMEGCRRDDGGTEMRSKQAGAEVEPHKGR